MLSGGVFQNRLLLERTAEALEGTNESVLTHQLNDILRDHGATI